MAIITIPTDVLPWIARQTMGNRHFDLLFRSDLTGAAQARLLAPPRWTCGLVSPDSLNGAEAALWRAFIMSLRGQVNQLAVYDTVAAAARAELADAYVGSPVLVDPVAVGDETIVAVDATQAGKWWRKGEYVGLGQSGSDRQLFLVMADAQADAFGEIELEVEPPPRYAIAAGEAVTHDKPTCLMRRTSGETSWSSDGMNQGGFSLDLMEAWEVAA